MDELYQLYTQFRDECILKAIYAYKEGCYDEVEEMKYLADVWESHRQCLMEIDSDES